MLSLEDNDKTIDLNKLVIIYYCIFIDIVSRPIINMKIRRPIEIEFQENADVAEYPLTSMPYIANIDALNESVVLYNPHTEYFPLDGFFVTDGHRQHVFRFPAKCKIPPLTELYLYCCPGKIVNHAALMEPHVLWTNHDGTLRKKEVLNNGKQRCFVA